MSTMIRSANAGSCSIVRSSPSATMPAQARLGSRRRRLGRTPRSAPSPQARSRRPRAAARSGPRARAPTCTSPLMSIAWIAPARAGSDDKRRARRSSRTARATISGASGRDAASSISSNVLRPASATSAATATGRRRWMNAIEEEEEQEQAEPRGRAPRAVTPTFGTKSASTCRRSVYENVNVPNKHRQRRLEHPVAVPEPHVAGGERPRRHLHDEHRDGDHEPDEAHARCHDRREHPLAVEGEYCQRVLTIDDRADVRRHETEGPTEHAADQRDHPEALPQVRGGAETRRSRSTASRNSRRAQRRALVVMPLLTGGPSRRAAAPPE